jgi:hypothetical protein
MEQVGLQLLQVYLQQDQSFSRNRYSTCWTLAFGGQPPTVATGATEEWTGPGVAVTKTITVS